MPEYTLHKLKPVILEKLEEARAHIILEQWESANSVLGKLDSITRGWGEITQEDVDELQANY